MEDQYKLLFQCYISDQMSEKQWQEHLKEDVGLKAWYDNYREEKKKAIQQKEQDYWSNKTQ